MQTVSEKTKKQQEKPRNAPAIEPMILARRFLAANYESRRLRRWAGDYYVWDGAGYALRDAEKIQAEIWRYLDAPIVDREGREWRIRPNSRIVGDARNALLGCGILIDGAPPAWLGGSNRPVPQSIIAFPNGLIDADADEPELIPPTPDFFTLSALEFPFAPDAPEPVEWLKFLGQLWPDDPASIDTLAEWFGYCLSARTEMQKALMLIGPPRSGKGTIVRVLRRLLGEGNVVAPTLAGLSTNFGLWPLIGKNLAVIGDARLSAKTDHAIITERILSITGEDSLTIDRKNREPITLKLGARIMLVSNGLPKLLDSSGALASRFIILILRESFLGREDTELFDRLLPELPGILLWALSGWRRLRARGRFAPPQSSIDATAELVELTAPISAFLDDDCIVEAGAETLVRDLFTAWSIWCAENGRSHPGDVQLFGRDLRSALPGLRTINRRNPDGTRSRWFDGIRLHLRAAEAVNLRNSQNNGGGL